VYKRFLLIIALMLFAALAAAAQQPVKVPRIGFVGATSAASVADRTQALRQGLADRGYVEGKNIVIGVSRMKCCRGP
jgi:Skp family chaperone for outer membrane proteins